MTSQNLSNILLAAASIQRRSFTPRFLNQALNKLLADGNQQELFNTLWSLSALGLIKENVFISLVSRLTELPEDLSPIHAKQLLYVSFRLALVIIPISHSDMADKHPSLSRSLEWDHQP